MKLAVLYICTGEYWRFWRGFRTSCDQHFCQADHKQYYVFSDSSQIQASGDTEVLYQDDLGWPMNTLFRFQMFLRIAERLRSYDKVVFFNANCEFIEAIEATEFFGVDRDFVAGLHPGFYDKHSSVFPYERRPASTAFVLAGQAYCQGALIGGSAAPFLDACQQLHRNIEMDLRNGLMAIWHDESHWNAFINNQHSTLSRRLQLLSPSFLYPEDWSLPFRPRILLREKRKVIDVDRIKGIPSTGVSPIRRFVRSLLRSSRGTSSDS